MTPNPLRLLAPLALALTVAPPVAAQSVADEDEMFCVYERASGTVQDALAELAVQPRDAAVATRMAGVAASALDACASQWHWGAEGRRLGLWLAAAASAADHYSGELPTAFSDARLNAIYQTLAARDRQALTVAGFARLTAAEREALGERLASPLAAQGLALEDHRSGMLYFTALARVEEAEALWEQLARKGKR